MRFVGAQKSSVLCDTPMTKNRHAATRRCSSVAVGPEQRLVGTLKLWGQIWLPFLTLLLPSHSMSGPTQPHVPLYEWGGQHLSRQKAL